MLVEVAVVRNIAFEDVLGDPVEAFGRQFARGVVNSPADFADIRVAHRDQLVVAFRNSPEEPGRNFHVEMDIAAEDNRRERCVLLVLVRQFDRLDTGNQIRLLGHMKGL